MARPLTLTPISRLLSVYIPSSLQVSHKRNSIAISCNLPAYLITTSTVPYTNASGSLSPFSSYHSVQARVFKLHMQIPCYLRHLGFTEVTPAALREDTQGWEHVDRLLDQSGVLELPRLRWTRGTRPWPFQNKLSRI